MTSVRFGLVGTGHWATSVHAAGLAAHPDIEFVGVWGRDPAKAAGVAAGHGATGYADADALIADVDALAFAVPPSIQAPIALRAAEAGRHLMLEKPVAFDPAEADRLVAAVEARGLSTVVFLVQRFVAPFEEWLAEIRTTSPGGGRVEWLTSQTDPNSPYAGSQWRREQGALWDVGPHMLSQLVYTLGPVVEMTGSRGVGDLVHLVLTHESGATSRMSLCLTMPPATKRVLVEFYGDQGWLQQPAADWDVHVFYRRALDELLENIGAGRTEHRCDVRFGRDLTHLITRCEAALDR